MTVQNQAPEDPVTLWFKRHRWQVWISIGVLFIAHPWLFALSGIISEYRFIHGLRTGMTSGEVTQLWAKTGIGTTDYGSEPIAVDSKFDFFFMKDATFCVEDHDHLQVYLDNRGRVASWTVTDEPGGC